MVLYLKESSLETCKGATRYHMLCIQNFYRNQNNDIAACNTCAPVLQQQYQASLFQNLKVCSIVLFKHQRQYTKNIYS